MGKLNPKKATGPDQVSTRILRDHIKKFSLQLLLVSSSNLLTVAKYPLTGRKLTSLQYLKREIDIALLITGQSHLQV